MAFFCMFQRCGLEPEFKEVYINWKKNVMAEDENITMGGLAR